MRVLCLPLCGIEQGLSEGLLARLCAWWSSVFCSVFSLGPVEVGASFTAHTTLLTGEQICTFSL